LNKGSFTVRDIKKGIPATETRGTDGALTRGKRRQGGMGTGGL